MTNLLTEVLLILTICLPTSDKCTDHVLATYDDAATCLVDASALRAATQDDQTFFITCMGVDSK